MIKIMVPTFHDHNHGLYTSWSQSRYQHFMTTIMVSTFHDHNHGIYISWLQSHYLYFMTTIMSSMGKNLSMMILYSLIKDKQVHVEIVLCSLATEELCHAQLSYWWTVPWWDCTVIYSCTQTLCMQLHVCFILHFVVLAVLPFLSLDVHFTFYFTFLFCNKFLWLFFFQFIFYMLYLKKNILSLF